MEQTIKEAMSQEELSLTNHKSVEIPYMLTTEEEQQHIERKIDSLKDHFRWKRKQEWVPFVSLEHKNMKEAALEMEINKIDWLQEFDKDEYLKKMNDLKYWALEERKRKDAKIQAEVEALENLKKKCDYKYMYSLMAANSRKYDKPLLVNNHNEIYIKAVCFFLSNDQRFETELKFSFKRGLLIRGNFGVGKTHIIRCVANNELHPIQMRSMIDITQKVNENGECLVNVFSKSKLYLDDVGTEEPTVNHYGTKINWFKDFIENQYMNEKVYPRLIITTNCSFVEIENKYGGRVRSRMAEMFNIIDVTGDDLRKK